MKNNKGTTDMDKFTAAEIEALSKLEFHWSEISKEFINDYYENEMGLYHDLNDGKYILRTRAWDDELCEYKDDYKRFETFADFLGYIV